MQSDSRITVAILGTLQAHPDIRCAYVYGSAQRGRLRPGSDIDVAVACQRPMTAEEKTSLRYEVEAAAGRDVDLVDLCVATGTILREAMHGTCILCRDMQTKYDLMRRLVYDQEDLQPLRRRMMDRRREAFVHGC